MTELISSVDNRTSMGTTNFTLSYESVKFRYLRRQNAILADFSWSVPPGKTVLLGPNGAGKSTLLMLGANALSPEHGHIKYGALDPMRRRDRVHFAELLDGCRNTFTRFQD